MLQFVNTCVEARDVGASLHYFPAFPMSAGRASGYRLHSPCDGSRCGREGMPCCNALGKELADKGFSHWPVPPDGDCLLHTCLFFEGAASEDDKG